jgi:hypothetical protein
MRSVLFQQAFLLPFCLCLLASVAILWFWATRNPVKRFRPPLGAIAVGGVMLFMISGGLSAFVAKSILNAESFHAQLKAANEPKRGYSGRAGNAVPGARGGSWDRILEADDANAQQDPNAPAPEQGTRLWRAPSAPAP